MVTLVSVLILLVFSSFALAGETKITDTQEYYTGYFTSFLFQTGTCLQSAFLRMSFACTA